MSLFPTKRSYSYGPPFSSSTFALAASGIFYAWSNIATINPADHYILRQKGLVKSILINNGKF